MTADSLPDMDSTSCWNRGGGILAHAKQLAVHDSLRLNGDVLKLLIYLLTSSNAQLCWNKVTEEAIEAIETQNHVSQTNMRWFYPSGRVHFLSRNTIAMRKSNGHTWVHVVQKDMEVHSRDVSNGTKGPSVSRKVLIRPWFNHHALEQLTCGMTIPWLRAACAPHGSISVMKRKSGLVRTDKFFCSWNVQCQRSLAHKKRFFFYFEGKKTNSCWPPAILKRIRFKIRLVKCTNIFVIILSIIALQFALL